MSASNERGMDISSGKTLPLENTKSPPASPASIPENANANHCWRCTSMPMEALRTTESRQARIAYPNGEWRTYWSARIPPADASTDR